MDKEFVSRIQSPWGLWYVIAAGEGVTRVQYEGDAPVGAGEVPYDLAHAWEAYETGLSDSVHLPIDLTATPEAQKLYLLIRQIPRGTQKSLPELADACGMESAQAEIHLAECPLPLAIPLHRVIEWRGVPEQVRCAMVSFEAAHPRLPKPEIPWAKGK